MKTIVAFWFMLFLSCVPSFGASTNYVSFLRIDKVYVLYTDPIVPHADRQGTFWVGLHPIAMLLGARDDERTASHTSTIIFKNHTLVFTAGAKTAVADNKPLFLSTPAKQIGRANQMVVPLAPLVHAFGLHTQWDRQYHVLTLVDAGLINEGDAGEFAGFVRQFEGPPSGYIAQVKTFAGPPYPISPLVPVELAQTGSQLTWKLKNVSGKARHDININVDFNGKDYFDNTTSGIPFLASFPTHVPTYSAYAAGLLRYKLSAVGSRSRKPLNYVAAWVVLMP